MAEEKKPVRTIVLDAGPLIANTPSISTLLNKSEEIFTTPSVISEIKDAAARSRLEMLVLPFITLRTPSIESMKFVTEFSRKSGDFAVLSKTDLEVVALAYELECERNGGDWRLRKIPGQKTLNGSPPVKNLQQDDEENTADGESVVTEQDHSMSRKEDLPQPPPGAADTDDSETKLTEGVNDLSIKTKPIESTPGDAEISASSVKIPNTSQEDGQHLPESSHSGADITDSKTEVVSTDSTNDPSVSPQKAISPETDTSSESEADSDGGDWITPSNINRHKTAVQPSSRNEPKQPKTLQVATLTSDHALQNTLLLINLNLLSSSFHRIHQIKSHILRCHACFATTKQMDKQFCPRCGQPTLTRVTSSTKADGTTQIFLKKNMQWNTRGNRYSIPKPVAGTSNGKMREKGGGKGGWGRDLILAEDQKEYVRAVQEKDRDKRRGEKDLFDQDFLPGFMSNDRGHGANGRIQIGAGRNVNSRKRN